MNTGKVGLEPHPEAGKVRYPKVAAVVLWALTGLLLTSGFEGWIPGAALELVLAVVLATAGWWNWTRPQNR